MNPVAHAQLTFHTLTLLQKYQEVNIGSGNGLVTSTCYPLLMPYNIIELGQHCQLIGPWEIWMTF